MTQQAQGSVHLLAASADSSHRPQIFRMRWDQPLRRFAKAYAAFRELGPGGEARLVMSTASHGALEMGASASVYALSDGDQVTFTTLAASAPASEAAPVATTVPDAVPPTFVAGVPTPARSASADVDGRKEACGTVAESAMAPSAIQGDGGCHLVSAASVTQTPAGHRNARFKCPVPNCEDHEARDVGFESEADYRQHLRAHFLSALDHYKQPPSAKAEQKRIDLGVRARRILGRAPSDPSRSQHAEQGGGRGRGRGRGSGKVFAEVVGHVQGGRGRGRALVALDAAAKKQKGRTSSGKSPVRGGRGTGKRLGKAKAVAKKHAKASPKRRISSAATLADFGPACEEGLGLQAEPNVRRGLMRTTTVKTGPALGWKVTAYLHKVSSRSESKGHDHTIAWRIVSPERSRAFDTFTSGRGIPNLRDAVGEGVYTQIYEAVRPGLIRKIAQRRNQIEGLPEQGLRKCARQAAAAPICDAEESPPARPRTPQLRTSPRTPASSGTRRGTPLTPAPLPPPAPLAAHAAHAHAGGCVEPTQLFALPPRGPAAEAQPSAKAWACDCEAHLRRHPRCVFAGPLQPPLVHLRDYMLIGRAESCDLTLDSRRTPQMLSRCHAVLHKEAVNSFSLTDQGSLNGILVNGDRVREKATLSNGDVVTFGVPTQHPELDYVFETRPKQLAD